MHKSSEKFNLLFIFLLIPTFILTFQSCNRKHSEVGEKLFAKTQNKVFKRFDTTAYNAVFKKLLADEKPNMNNPDIIAAYYTQNNYEPTLVLNHLFNGDLKNSVTYFNSAKDHGLNPVMFSGDEISTLIEKFGTKEGIKTIDEAYRYIAELELLEANSLITYANALQFGVINPKKIYARYYTVTKRPDSNFMSKALQQANLKAYLDSIQPRDTQYVALQKALANGYQAPGLSVKETKRAIIVNLERLRWKNKPTQHKFVIVNIPDYMLNVIDSGRAVLSMKVCVGQGRNKGNSYSLDAYVDSAKTDVPFTRETPQLNSMIHSVQVNPVWNIPQSIVTKEIIRDAQDDRYYLANKGIEVFKKGRKIENTESINWKAAAQEGSDYSFKQKPGGDNSLGKIKFLFNNESDVYLHDTPAKSAFRKEERDVSHGCVRLGDPQALALRLFGAGKKYDIIAKDMADEKPDPTTIYFSKRVPVFITYITCWKDAGGTLQFRNDVYGLDVVLYNSLLKFI